MTEQIQPSDSLDDRGVDDILDEGFSPPEYRNIKDHDHETMDERLAEEEPDISDTPSGDDAAFSEYSPADQRSGRLVAPDQGTAEDEEDEAWADSVGIDGAGASAEEAAVHVIGDDAL